MKSKVGKIINSMFFKLVFTISLTIVFTVSIVGILSYGYYSDYFNFMFSCLFYLNGIF